MDLTAYQIHATVAAQAVTVTVTTDRLLSDGRAGLVLRALGYEGEITQLRIKKTKA